MIWKQRSELEIKVTVREVAFKAISLDEIAYFTEHKYQIFKSQVI